MSREGSEGFVDSQRFAALSRALEALDSRTRAAFSATPHRRLVRDFRIWSGVPYRTFVEAAASTGSVYSAAHALRLCGADRLADRVITVAPVVHEAESKPTRFIWGRSRSPFGDCVIAESGQGLCHLEFFEHEAGAFARTGQAMKQRGFAALWQRDDRYVATLARRVFGRGRRGATLCVHLHGTAFQREVWQALLALDSRSVIAYGALAATLGRGGAARAVGAAVGRNRIGWLVPCHHVVTSHGLAQSGLGGFHWGVARKRAMLVWESVSVAS